MEAKRPFCRRSWIICPISWSEITFDFLSKVVKVFLTHMNRSIGVEHMCDVVARRIKPHPCLAGSTQFVWSWWLFTFGHGTNGSA